MNEYGLSQGMARNASESEYPNLWRGLAGLWCPGAGLQGRRLINFAARNYASMSGQTWVSGRRGKALAFTAADYLTSPEVSLGTVHSAMAWIRPSGQTGPANYGCMLGNGNSGNTSALIVKGNIDNGISYTESTGDVAVPVSSMSGQWHHLASVRRDQTVSLFLDGKLMTTGTLPGNSAASVIYIGSRGDNAVVYYGALDDLRVYTRTLSAQEIMQSYLGASPLVRRQAGASYRSAAFRAAWARRAKNIGAGPIFT